MRGINRFLAGILLAGAVAGAAVFARHSGRDSSAYVVELAAPPQQHVGAPGTLLFTPSPTPPRLGGTVRGRVQPSAGRPALAATAAPAGRTTIPPVTLRRPVAAVQAQTPAAAAAVQTPQPTRVLAAVQPATVQPPPVQPAPVTNSGKNKGHGHSEKHGDDTPHAVDAPVAPAPADPALTQAMPVDPSPTSSGDAPGSDDSTGNGNGHGHGSGHTKGHAKPDGN